ncbi:MAG: hypothetical protein IPP94_11125 [Ignavibacteria bacterium]|nr:hypothetical protein [Ignavibacteria bacterium]
MFPPHDTPIRASVFRSAARHAWKPLAILLAIIVSAFLFPKQAAGQHLSVSFQMFYDELSPYGQWVDYPGSGYVWIPDAEEDFTPYSSQGHWVFTEYGWTWVSDYRWGWAPFHYGRWNHDERYGWIWFPDDEWGPSWVTWRRANGYYGWAPMGHGISINLSFGGRYDHDNDHWMFVRDRDFGRSDMHRYYINRNEHERIGRNSTVINQTYIDNSRHTTYIAGPRREDVQRSSGRTVPRYRVQDNDRPGQELQKDRLRIYRPLVEKGDERGRKVAPSRVADLKEVRERRQAVPPQNTRPSDNNTRDRNPGTVQPQNPIERARPVAPENTPSRNDINRDRRGETIQPQKPIERARPVAPESTPSRIDLNRDRKGETVQPQKPVERARPVTPESTPSRIDLNRDRKGETVQPQKPVERARPVTPESTPSRNDMNRNRKSETVQPQAPVERARPVQPQAPVERARPVQPQQPVERARPVQPQAPVERARPVQPQKPIERAQPSQPQNVKPQENNNRGRQPSTVAPARERSEQPKAKDNDKKGEAGEINAPRNALRLIGIFRNDILPDDTGSRSRSTLSPKLTA